MHAGSVKRVIWVNRLCHQSAGRCGPAVNNPCTYRRWLWSDTSASQSDESRRSACEAEWWLTLHQCSSRATPQAYVTKSVLNRNRPQSLECTLWLEHTRWKVIDMGLGGSQTDQRKHRPLIGLALLSYLNHSQHHNDTAWSFPEMMCFCIQFVGPHCHFRSNMMLPRFCEDFTFSPGVKQHLCLDNNVYRVWG